MASPASAASTVTLAELSEAVTTFGELARPDRSYSVFQAATEPNLDFSRLAHRLALHKWLNAWGCRIRYPREGDPPLFDRALSEWWDTWQGQLPGSDTRLAALDEPAIDALAGAYGDLSSRGVALARKAGSVRTLGPTATAKALYAARPMAVTAWDQRIAHQLHGGRDEDAFREHLHLARRVARALLEEAGDESRLLAAVGRPHSSLAKLLDEYWYITITRHR